MNLKINDHNSFESLKILFNKNSIFVGLDQFITSLFNFILLIYLSNNFDLIEVGKYSLIFSFQMILQMLFFCIIYEPLNIEKYSKNRKEIFQILLFLLMIITLFIFFIIYYFKNFLDLNLNYYILLYFNLIFIKEFIKKINIQKLISYLNFLISLITYTLLTIYLFYFTDDKLNNIFDIYFYLFLFEIFFFIFFFKKIILLIKDLNLISFKKVFIDLKKRSSSLLLFYFAKDVGNYFLVFLITIFVGFQLAAIFRIFQSILGVINTFILAMENIYPHRLSQIYQNSKLDFRNTFIINLSFIVILFLFVVLIINYFLEDILKVLYSVNNVNYEVLFLVMSLVLLTGIFNNFVRFYLRITDNLNKLDKSNLIQLFIILFIAPLLLIEFKMMGLILTISITTINYLFLSTNIFLNNILKLK